MMRLEETFKCYIEQFYTDRILLFRGDSNYFGVKCTEDSILSHSEGHEDGASISSWSISTCERGI